MHPALFKYYYDLTRYNIIISLLVGFVKFSPFVGIFSFATFSMPISIFCYQYFQKHQYYFYYNLGISKTKLVIFTWIINLIIASILLLIMN